MALVLAVVVVSIQAKVVPKGHSARHTYGRIILDLNYERPRLRSLLSDSHGVGEGDNINKELPEAVAPKH